MRDEFKALIGDGLDPAEATQRLISEWAEVVEDPDDGPVFWLALAATQARLGRLVDEVRDRALAVIESGENLRRWEEDASAADVAKRRRHLDKLKEELLGEPRSPRKVAKEYVEVTDWQVGQLWAYRLRSGRYLIFRVKERRSDFMTGGGVLPLVEVLDRLFPDVPLAAEVVQVKARTRRSEYAPDDPMRPSNELLLMRATKTDYPADRLTLIGSAGPERRRSLSLLRRRRQDEEPLMPTLWPWKYLDRELAENWGAE